MITVAFTVSTRRPRYLRHTLESWANVRGIEQAKIVLSLEPPIRVFDVGAFRQWLQGYPCPVSVNVAHEQLGCNKNTRRAMAVALAQSDFAVMAEEDTEVADDILEYYAWAAEEYRGAENVLAVCAHMKHAPDEARSDQVIVEPWFSPLGWGTWADRWFNLLDGPWGDYTDSWDALVRTVALDNQLSCVFPARSRTFHFGEASTLTPRMAGGAPNYFHRTALSSCFAGHYEPQEYREAHVSGAVLY